MTRQVIVDQSDINAELERVLSDMDDGGLRLARNTISKLNDRWYGQLVVHAYASLTDTHNPDPEIVLPAAAGIELLRGYVHLRSQLLTHPDNKSSHSLTLDPTPALLAGDYLYTAAFSSLCSANTLSNSSFERFTTILTTITEVFTLTYTSAESSNHDQEMFFDKTAGSFGVGAAVLGATVADATEPIRRQFERFGRGLSTARQINRVLDADLSETTVVPPPLNESKLHTHAQRRRDEADQALKALSATADVTSLRAFVETTAGEST